MSKVFDFIWDYFVAVCIVAQIYASVFYAIVLVLCRIRCFVWKLLRYVDQQRPHAAKPFYSMPWLFLVLLGICLVFKATVYVQAVMVRLPRLAKTPLVPLLWLFYSLFRLLAFLLGKLSPARSAT